MLPTIKKSFLILLSLSLCITVFSQNQGDTIRVKKTWDGYKFERNGKYLDCMAMSDLMKDNPEAYKYMGKAINTGGISHLLQLVGGFMVGWPIGTALGGGKPKWELAEIGGGLLLISIPLSISSRKNEMIAIEKYNAKKRGLTYNGHYDLKFGFNPQGFVLALNF